MLLSLCINPKIIVFATGCSFLTAAMAAGQPAWKRVATPEQLTRAEMAFDTARGEAIMFGGTDLVSGSGRSNGETWAWDGVRWRCAATTGPAPRNNHTMVYDSRRGVVVLYGGGSTGSSISGNELLWEWNGTTWTRRVAPEPGNRNAAAMAFDSHRGVSVLFGGLSNQTDTWEWDGSIWTRHVVPGPSARAGHAMCFDAQRGVSVLYGGVLNETWEWNGVQWQRIVAPGPATQSGHSLVFDGNRGRCVLCGGFGDGNNQSWEWDGSTWTIVANGTLPFRYNQAAAFDAVRGQLFIYGGEIGPIGSQAPGGEGWCMAEDGWNLCAPVPPLGRVRFLVSEAPGGGVLLFGGDSLRRGPLSDTHIWNGELWTAAANGPRRNAPAGAFDSLRQVVVMFGGSFSDETWEWNGAQWNLRATTQRPAAREEHSMAYDSARRRTILFGGTTGTSQLGDTWSWDGQTWRQIEEPGPEPRVRAAMAYDVHRDRTVLYGGTGTRTMEDTWEWDGARWTRISATGPSLAVRGAAYDPLRRRVVMTSGGTDLWSWNGATWDQLAALNGPPNRFKPSLAFDSHTQSLFLFGGGSYMADTWTLEAPPLITSVSTLTTLCRTGSTVLRADALGTPPLTIRWESRTETSDWAAVSDGPLVVGGLPTCAACSGSTTAELVVSLSCTSDTALAIRGLQFRCVVGNAAGEATGAPSDITICSMDFDCDGAANADDLAEFINCYFASPPCPLADFNGDGEVNADDVAEYLDEFFQGSC